ncbi:PE family protein [Mycobacterium basiliense]|uniref:PE family protein n=1 Tax=Mycobacterium basiliense TaxID=2094119 RepID=A0A447GL98_9MYCO|nr:PE family protein [Mycobacterium basiliense]VDM91199.1 PE family protein [Mycobacterium basiliense]
MSFVVTAPEMVTAAAGNLAQIGSTIENAVAAAVGPTTQVATAAADEVSIAISQLFGTFGQEFQAISSQAAAFHADFVDLLNGGATAYLNAEIANAEQNLASGPASGLMSGQIGAEIQAASGAIAGAPALRRFGAALVSGLSASSAAAAPLPGGAYQQLFANTAANLQSLGSAWAARPFPLLSQIIANQQVYGQQLAVALANAIANFPAALANLPATIQAAIQQLLNFDVAYYLQQFIATQLGFAQTAGSELSAAINEVMAGLPAYSSGLELAFHTLLAGDFSGAAVELAKAHANLLVTGVDTSNVVFDIPNLRVTENVKLLGPLGHLFTLAGIPGQEAQYLTNQLPAGSIPRQMSQNFANMIKTLTDPTISATATLRVSPLGVDVSALFGTPLVLTYAAAGAPVSAMYAAASSATAIQQALATGNGFAALGSLVDAPAVIANGFLNNHSVLDLTVPVPLPQPFTQTLAVVLHMPIDGILVPPHAVTATVDLRSIGGGTIDVPIGGTPFSGMVPLVINYVPQQLASAITPAA